MSETKSLPDVFDFVCEHLPEDWRIVIDLESNAGSVELIDPEGETVDCFPDDEGPFEEFVRKRVNFARDKDGLGPVEWDGSAQVDA